MIRPWERAPRVSMTSSQPFTKRFCENVHENCRDRRKRGRLTIDRRVILKSAFSRRWNGNEDLSAKDVQGVQLIVTVNRELVLKV